ncbi:hypothetical protein [Dyadobacter sandarakinus]|uniref:Uncharacterized protein n=1 Tax=Dyadobacter sandarakinus TaxID=2747268 RepID=A0ABX7I4W7_9BACT|nr:hypothetical protein [Dyadobacter sandarakinus]QRR01134.1 hypothetical protein HWI92_09560 [Dyadobacter sandarakinus]
MTTNDTPLPFECLAFDASSSNAWLPHLPFDSAQGDKGIKLHLTTLHNK